MKEDLKDNDTPQCTLLEKVKQVRYDDIILIVCPDFGQRYHHAMI